MFSICIPNFNYATFIERTIRSALSQEGVDLEVVVSDNASTDGSVEAVEQIRDPRIVLSRNPTNVGFAGNLDCAVRASGGDRILLLPSDDLLKPGILAGYQRLLDGLGPSAHGAVIGTAVDLIDPDDKVIGRTGPDRRIWEESDRVSDLEPLFEAPVYRVAGEELLRRSLRVMTNPFNFQTTCYPRSLYDRVGGYGGGRVINPDKWFHWRLLGAAEHAYYVDRSLGAFRWHPSNQTAQQAASGALKFLVDEYVSTFELDSDLLKRLGLKRDDVAQLFVEYDIARHGLATLGSGNRGKARRIVKFGEAAYPKQVARNPKLWVLRALLAAGPLGSLVTKAAYARYSGDDPRHRAPKP